MSGKQVRQQSKSHLKRKRSTAALVLLLAALLVAQSCQNDESEYGGAVTIPLLRGLEGFHPLIDRNVDATALQLVYNSLIKIDESLEPVSDLAESWIVSGDGTQWDFILREGVTFHDGHIFDSNDVVFTLEEILRGGDSYAVSPLYANIKSIQATGALAVRIELRQPYAPLLHLLTIEILPSHLLENGEMSGDDFRINPIGTGPFMLSSWDDDAITLTAYEGYFEGRPYLDTVRLRTLQDSTQAWSELMQGRVSIVTDLDPDDFKVIDEDERFTTYSYLDLFYYTILLNFEDPLLMNPAVRSALKMAIDTEGIVGETLNGRADVTTGPFIPGTWSHNQSVSTEYDPPEAAKMLADEGWADTDDDGILDNNGKKLEISLLIDEGDGLKESVAQQIKWQLFQIGVQVNVEYLAPREFLQERIYPGLYQAALLQFNAAGDPDNFTFLFWHSSRIGASNLARYRNTEVDRLIEEGRSESDIEKRRTVYRGIHQIMADDTASIFLFVRRIYIGATSQIEGLMAEPQSLMYSVRDWKIRAQ
jgi:peptide/nickel transport system substrate-binding protein